MIRKWAGVVDPEKVKPLIEKGYLLAEMADDERKWSAVMNVIRGFAKLEQDEGKAEPDSGSTTNILINDHSVHTNDGRTEFAAILAAALERARKAEAGGTIDSPTDTLASVPATPAD